MSNLTWPWGGLWRPLSRCPLSSIWNQQQNQWLISLWTPQPVLWVQHGLKLGWSSHSSPATKYLWTEYVVKVHKISSKISPILCKIYVGHMQKFCKAEMDDTIYPCRRFINWNLYFDKFLIRQAYLWVSTISSK